MRFPEFVGFVERGEVSKVGNIVVMKKNSQNPTCHGKTWDKHSTSINETIAKIKSRIIPSSLYKTAYHAIEDLGKINGGLIHCYLMDPVNKKADEEVIDHEYFLELRPILKDESTKYPLITHEDLKKENFNATAPVLLNLADIKYPSMCFRIMVTLKGVEKIYEAKFHSGFVTTDSWNAV